MSAEHSHSHEDHGASQSGYIKGFIMSVILTVIPFAIVMSGGLESRGLTLLLVVGFAIVQVLVHMVYFLHMTSSQEEGWTLLSTVFTIVVVVIMFSGSLWVMLHLSSNMMPLMPPDITGIGNSPTQIRGRHAARRLCGWRF